MKIGIVVQNFPPALFEGGISHYSALLGQHLTCLGYQVYALTSTEFTKPVDRSEMAPEVNIVRIPGPWGPGSVKHIKQHAARLKLDAIILQYSPASFNIFFRFAWAISAFPCRKLTAFHTLWGRGLDRILGLMVLFGSPEIIATNSEIMTILERRLPCLLKRTCWIPIGGNILPLYQDVEEFGSGDSMICFFGMLYPGKGLDRVLGVAEELKKRSRRFVLVLIGGGMRDHEQYEYQFQKEIEKRGLTEIVIYKGFLPAEEASCFFRKSRIVFLPYDMGVSDRRGSFMAALAHGKAVLTSPPVVEMPFLKNNINVLWPGKPSVAAYADLMEMLLDNDALVKTLESGATELAGNFLWHRIASEYELALRPESGRK